MEYRSRKTIAGTFRIGDAELGQLGEFAVHKIAPRLPDLRGYRRVTSKYGDGWGADAAFVLGPDGAEQAVALCESKVDGGRLDPQRPDQLSDGWISEYARQLRKHGWIERANSIQRASDGHARLVRKLFHFRTDDGSVRIWNVDADGRCVPPRTEAACPTFVWYLRAYSTGVLKLQPRNKRS